LWGGPERVAEGLAAYGEAGAAWVVVGPLDSGNPDNARVLGEAVLPLLR
jgi:alkanesulfonate monooxygenase SsuD/methylene tetrahydromethanopterin reductase-like flavin-dependent oxidoreductase (luciferase family)